MWAGLISQTIGESSVLELYEGQANSPELSMANFVYAHCVKQLIGKLHYCTTESESSNIAI